MKPAQQYKLPTPPKRGKGRTSTPLSVKGTLIWASSRAGTFRKPETIQRQLERAAAWRQP